MGNPRPSSRTKNPGTGADSELHAAARVGDLRAVESLCSSDPLAVNSRDKHSRTPLHLAAWSGHAEIANYLCKHNADAGASAVDDTGAIHFASQKGHVEVVRGLFSCGVSVKAANRKGMTPLHFAVQGSHLELIKYLIRKGANLGAKNKSGETPLDLVKSEEVRSFIAECGKSLNNEDQKTASKAEELPLKPSNSEGSKNAADARDSGDQPDVDIVVREKRKGEVVTQDGLPYVKKAKVSLMHLLAEDDMEEELGE